MATNNAINVATAATGTILRGAGVGTAPVFSTATYPATTTSQQILYSSATNTVTGLTSGNSLLAATNAAGTLAMRALSVVNQVFSASGTYTPTTGMLYCIIQCVGGGGGGGGANITGAGDVSVGGGGGSGEYAQGVFSAATIGASQSVTIGAAGASNSAAAGGNGGNTSVGALISANGGIGGGTSVATTSAAIVGGLGGTGGSGGSFRTPGPPGFTGLGSIAGGIVSGGEGGSSHFGAGGVSAGANAAGNAALGFGSGGSSVLNFISQAARAGGVGTAGFVLVTEYVIA